MKKKYYSIELTNGGVITFNSKELCENFVNACIEKGVMYQEDTDEFVFYYEEKNGCGECDDCEKCDLYGVDCGGYYDERRFYC